MTATSYQQFVDISLREYKLPYNQRPFLNSVKFHTDFYYHALYYAEKGNMSVTTPSETLGEFTVEQALVLMYKSAILRQPLDRAFQPLKVGDTVSSTNCTRGTITRITKKGYIQFTVFGTNRLHTSPPDLLFKISEERDFTL